MMERAVQNINNMITELDQVQKNIQGLIATLKFEQKALRAPLEKIVNDLDSLIDLEYDIFLLNSGDYSTAVNDLTFTDQYLDLVISHLMHLQRNTKIKISRNQDETISAINKHLMHIQGSLMIVLNQFKTDEER
ncbi:hypothetical protein [Ligilactobacillus salitolerans]|nr:hypothetical protein [Ligilactobacillus salitolerans]